MEVAGLELVVPVLTEGAVDLQVEAVLVVFTEEVVEVVMEEEDMSDLEAQVVEDLDLVVMALTEVAVA
jgi:hypothetical protein